MQPKIMEKYFFFGLIIITFIFAFFIFRPFWIILTLGASFSIILYPVYIWLKKGHFPNWLAAFLTLIFFIIVLCVPLFGLGSIVFSQSQNLYHSIIGNGNTTPFLNLIGNKINQILPNGTYFNINEVVSGFVSFIANNIANIFNATITLLFSFIKFTTLFSSSSVMYEP